MNKTTRIYIDNKKQMFIIYINSIYIEINVI